MRIHLLALSLIGLFAGCSADWHASSRDTASQTRPAVAIPDQAQLPASLPQRAPGGFASLPDRGDLVAYDHSRTPVRTKAYVWHPVEVSEEHAVRAIGGELVLSAPNGEPIRLRYERHLEHKDGNWTWIGRPLGALPGVEAIITFGEKAVFGTIPYGDRIPLNLTIEKGKAWLMETDGRAVATLDAANPKETDALLPPSLRKPMSRSGGSLSSAAAPVAEAVPLDATTTVDVLLGYTAAFATRLGGQSQAHTRLTFITDVANQSFQNSQIDARVRLVKTVQVSYPDATPNKTALHELTGVACTDSGCEYVGPAVALQPLHTARDQYGADVVSLVRNFNYPENEGCGIAWVIGGGQSSYQASDEYAGMSVVSDSNGTGGGGSFPDDGYVCRTETLAHEIGHNLGSTHDRATARGTDDSNGDGNLLDPEEYGRYPYSFGYKTAAGAGNFFTVMAYGDSGQSGYRVFSNPAITSCGGFACGFADSADNARSLRQTMPIAATFRAKVVDFYDIPPDFWAFDAIKRIANNSVTTGCSNFEPYAPLYCPNSNVTRDQMAVFLLRGIHGGSYVPPAASGVFADVPLNHWAVAWIERFYNEGITLGCATGPLRYCPDNAVTRAEMAVFLLRARYGASYVPPAATGVFQDVPTSYWAAAWIEKLASDGITLGCSATPKQYCPQSSVSRDQMAVFLMRTFNL